MKISKIILTLLCTITLFSCEEGGEYYEWYGEEYVHDDNNITVHSQDEYNSPIRDSLRLMIATYRPTLYIKGGDRNYTITPPDTNLLDVKLEKGNMLIIEPLKSGNVEIPIMDGANHSYVLKINMQYYTTSLVVTRTEIVIKGDGLTELQKDTIREKALKTIPVKVDGGYKFTYTELLEKGRAGVVSIYPNHFGDSDDAMEECSVEYIYRESDKKQYLIININDSKRVFRYGGGRLPTKSNNTLMIEDITKMFKTKYPAVEKVFAQQQCIDPRDQDYYEQ